jgi:hypothetical protein
MAEAGRGAEYSAVLKTRNLLIFRDAQNAESGKIAPNWNELWRGRQQAFAQSWGNRRR